MATTAIRVERHPLRHLAGHPAMRGALCVVVALVVISGGGQTAAAQGSSHPGYPGFSYGSTPTPSPTGEKSQSKLWWAGGTWWGCLFNAEASRYHIYRLDRVTEEWIDTGTPVDDRPTSKADVLWDEDTSTLYIVSNYFTVTPTATSASSARWGRLYRYTYLPAEDRYVLDSGFPVTVTKGTAEALTIAKDSTGRLWVTWVESGVVKINHSLSNDVTWNDPSTLPVGEGGATSLDDISGVVAFGGGQIGVMWTNQNANTVYFAVRNDTDPFDLWQPLEHVLPLCTGACADDHLNLKADSTGRVFAVTKTSLTAPADPLIVLSVRDALGAWTNSTVAQVQDDHTRPMVLVAEDVSRVWVFASYPEAGGSIYYKTSPLNSISFAPGRGTLFMKSPSGPRVNNATSTKGAVSQTTGIVVLAADPEIRRYRHNGLSLAPAPVVPRVQLFSPSTGAVGTSVVLTGSGFAGASAVTFGGAAAAFVAESDTTISAWVPEGASTGRIAVANGATVAASAANFVVPEDPQASIEAKGADRVTIRIDARPASDVRIEQLSNAGAIFGNIVLLRSGQPFGNAFASLSTATWFETPAANRLRAGATIGAVAITPTSAGVHPYRK